jgi:hypothetical protein
MMHNFKMWYIRNATEITWFIIGWMTVEGFNSLAKADYVNASISLGLAFLNYMLYKR